MAQFRLFSTDYTWDDNFGKDLQNAVRSEFLVSDEDHGDSLEIKLKYPAPGYPSASGLDGYEGVLVEEEILDLPFVRKIGDDYYYSLPWKMLTFIGYPGNTFCKLFGILFPKCQCFSFVFTKCFTFKINSTKSFFFL